MVSTPQQPSLRSFIVYDRLPSGAVAYPVADNRNAPHLRVGDFVIIDHTDKAPCAGELFVMEWTSSPGLTSINETFEMPGIVGWCVGPVAQPVWLDGLVAEGMPPRRWCDFGYTDALLRDRLKGRVIGLLQSTYAEPMEVLQ